jgi:hypothetical protein
MRKFIKDVFTDELGNYSSKRLCGILCILTLVVCLLATVFIDTREPSEALIDALALFAFGSFGLTSLDKFTYRNSRAKEIKETN